MSRVLVVDGAPSIRESVRMILGGEHEVVPAASAEEAASLARTALPDLVLVGGPAGSRRRPPDLPPAWLAPLRQALPAAVAGRLVPLPLPFGVAELRGLVRRALAETGGAEAGRPASIGAGSSEHRWVQGERAAAERLWRDALLREVLAAADPAGRLSRTAARAAATTLPVLLVGERGTGRETLARWLHAEGPLRDGPFVAVTCAGLTPAELAARLSRLPAAPVRPTLFLRGLDQASPALQQALLELLECGSIGGTPEGWHPVTLEVRPIASASEAVWERVEAGSLAEPLVGALACLTLVLPPLRERPAAIAAAAGPILERLAHETGEPAPRRLSPSALARLSAYCWPGNLRELASVLARSAALATEPVLEAEDLDFGLTPWIPACRTRAASVLAEAAVTAPGPAGAAAPETEAPPCSGAPTGTRLAGTHRSEGSGGRADQPEGRCAPGGGERPEAEPAGEPPAGVDRVTTADHTLATAEGAAARAGGLEASFAALAGELAHELKNPLVAIKTFTQLLAEKFDDPEFRREFYRIVRRELERIDHLVEGILHAADTVPRTVRPTDLNRLLDEVLVQSEPWMIERRVVTFKDVAEGLPPVLVDPAQARAALFNVIVRALASLSPGEDLFIATRPGPPIRLAVTYREASSARPPRTVHAAELRSAGAPDSPGETAPTPGPCPDGRAAVPVMARAGAAPTPAGKSAGGPGSGEAGVPAQAEAPSPPVTGVWRAAPEERRPVWTTPGGGELPGGPGQGPERAPLTEELELMLAREVLVRAGGRLVVAREPGHQTTVTIEFRAASEEEPWPAS